MDDAPSKDRLFGDLLVEQGVAARAAVEECLAILARLRAEGVTPIPTLGELLVQRGHLSSAAYQKTLRAGSTPAPSAPAALPDQVRSALADAANDLGPFVRLQLLGRGGMGEVWKAWDRELGRPVALKFLLLSDPADEARFTREAQVAAGLSHPNIASVHSVGRHEGRPYIVMRLVEGATLSRAGLPPRALLEAMRDAARALDYAHGRGVVHRDVKPENLMVEGSHVFVMDFGLARATHPDRALSQSGAVVGTPQYMSPEQAQGQTGLVGPRSDVYSLGATLYALLAGRPPHDASDVLSLLRKIAADDPPPPRLVNPAIAPDLETVVLKAMEKEPARRYGTAGEMADDLQRFLDGEPVRARRASVVYRLRKRLAKRKALAATGAAGLAATIALVLALASRQREQRSHADEVAALRELGALWTQVLLEKRELHHPKSDPKKVFERLRGAVAALDDHVRRHPDQPQGWYVRARARLYLDDLEDAERDLREALRRDDGFAPGHALLGSVKLEQHTRRMYAPTWNTDKAGKAAPLLREARAELARGWKEGGGRASIESWGLARTPEDTVMEELTKALSLVYLDGDREGAKRALLEANAREEAAEYYNWLALFEAAPAEEIELHTKAIEKMAHYAKAYLDRAIARYRSGDPKELDPSIADTTRALEINPRLASAWGNRGLVRSHQGDLDGAIADFDRALELDPGDAVPRAYRGHARFVKGETAGALEDYDEALRIEPRFLMARLWRAGSRHLARDYAGSVEDCTRALEIDPEQPMALLTRGMSQEEGSGADHLEAALADYEAVLRSPASEPGHRELAENGARRVRGRLRKP
jgi:serine/threonine-protein kinase